ncbi:MAG: MoaD/ThiS family protein [Myxococcota bacterium]
MTIYIPTPLRELTRRQPLIEGQGDTLAEALEYLELLHPGLLSCLVDEGATLREHIRLLVNSEPVRCLQHALAPHDEIHILCTTHH